MRMVLVGGFLGAGKTTAIAKAALLLKQKGIEAAVITNDQGEQLVDARYIAGNGIVSDEVRGGCFCCRFDQLHAALESLTKGSNCPIVFAESVGTCTDLVATVLKPLQRFYPQMKINLSVFTDAVILYSHLRAHRFLFKKNVQYIFDKQLEEADIIIVNKTDLLAAPDLAWLKQLLSKTYRTKKVLFQSSLLDEDISAWLTAVNETAPVMGKALQLDYEIYGAGEAELAWLDSTIVVESKHAELQANDIINAFQAAIDARNWPVGHLKFFIGGQDRNAKISITANDTAATRLVGFDEARRITLTINARVECEPEALARVFKEMLERLSKEHVKISIAHMAAFKPGYPVPVHRILN